MNNPADQKNLKWFGLIAIVAGIIPMLVSKPTEGTPYWVAYLACSVFIIAGAILIAQSYNIHWVAPVLGPAIILIFAVIASWIAFAPGERQCTGSISLPFYSGKTLGSCTIPFGIAAVLCWLFFIYAVYAMIRSRKAGDRNS